MIETLSYGDRVTFRYMMSIREFESGIFSHVARNGLIAFIPDEENEFRMGSWRELYDIQH